MKTKTANKEFKLIALFFRQDFARFGIGLAIISFNSLGYKFGIIIDFAFWELEITIK